MGKDLPHCMYRLYCGSGGPAFITLPIPLVLLWFSRSFYIYLHFSSLPHMWITFYTYLLHVLPDLIEHFAPYLTYSGPSEGECHQQFTHHRTYLGLIDSSWFPCGLLGTYLTPSQYGFCLPPGTNLLSHTWPSRSPYTFTLQPFPAGPGQHVAFYYHATWFFALLVPPPLPRWVLPACQTFAALV